MNGNPIFPFERNRYYSGKMLASADFATEQKYVNHKRRFLNNYMYGAGIVCGCNVYNIDELTVFIESGLALDSSGREIVLDNSIVKKLSAIAGFDETESEQVTLCLRYKEELVQPVYAVNKEDNECEYNRIQEGYELFLMDTQKKKVAKENTDFLIQEMFYKDDNYELWMIMPTVVSKNRFVKIQFKVKKISPQNAALSFQGNLQMPSFFTQEGKKELEIHLSALHLEEGETKVCEYGVFVQETSSTKTSVILKQGIINTLGEDKILENELSLKVRLSERQPREFINYELGKLSLEKTKEKNSQEYICLANISLLRSKEAYKIEKVEEKDVKQYIETPSQNELRSEYLEFFRGIESVQEPVKKNVVSEGESVNTVFSGTQMQVATGVIEIPIGGKARAGEVFYSGEVMHGLGTGAVYVEIGQEFIEEDGIEGANTKSTVYGNSKLFSKMGNLIPKTEKAVKVLNDKGSFIAAVSFTEDTDCLMLSYRWAAVKLAGSETAELLENTEKQRIEAKTPTVVLGTGESYYFGVKFHEMDKCSITYQVMEEDGGKITMDGIYTAPNKEGVYEIMISCIEYPYICTYAYAIVKKK